MGSEGDLRSVFAQFERQNRTRPNVVSEYYLVTSSRSSRKVIYEMRAALEAFRLGSELRFRSDQPQALVQIIDDLLAMLSSLQIAAGEQANTDAAHAILRKSYVVAFDIDPGQAVEQGLLLVLQSQNFAAPAAFWGKLVADCVSHSALRHSVDVAVAIKSYERFRLVFGQVAEESSDDLIRSEFGRAVFPVGREVVLCRWTDKFAILELYRFDDNCQARTKFYHDTIELLDGIRRPLLRRAATFDGMARLIKATPALIGQDEVVFFPMNSDDDYEKGICAETHREVLRRAALSNPHPYSCIHCGKPVSSNSASIVEAGHDKTLTVGLSHEACLAPDDRVLGSIRSQLFEDHPELVNFDVHGWFRASQSGQFAIAYAKTLSVGRPVLAWAGRRRRAPKGSFVIALRLQGGEQEFTSSRGEIDRFSKADADSYATRMNDKIRRMKETDPLCFTEQTKSFGPRSMLIQQLGGKERLLVVDEAIVRPYDERVAARYARPGNWYAPVFYLLELSTGKLFSILGSVVLLTSPLSLRNHLDNWRQANVPIPNYELVCLLTDREFDDFMIWLEDQGLNAVVDPMLLSDRTTEIISGMDIVSVDAMDAQARNQTN